MTRINLVEPHQLKDKHLMAEYRELPRIFTAVLKLQAQGKTPADVTIPDHYVLGTGHMRFFYNKISWLRRRYVLLEIELTNRGFKLDENLFEKIYIGAAYIERNWCSDYTPRPEDIYLNMVRLCKRSNLISVLEELWEKETP
jgi:deoxyribonuclease (pyrimidine dimer)